MKVNSSFSSNAGSSSLNPLRGSEHLIKVSLRVGMLFGLIRANFFAIRGSMVACSLASLPTALIGIGISLIKDSSITILNANAIGSRKGAVLDSQDIALLGCLGVSAGFVLIGHHDIFPLGLLEKHVIQPIASTCARLFK